MLYYLGKGMEFKKEDCKEYKKLDAALKAAAKDESLVVWDETGKVIGSLTDDVPEGALQTNPDGSIPAFNEDGTPAGTVDSETVAAVTGERRGRRERLKRGQGDKSTDRTGKRRKWSEYRGRRGNRGRAGGQGHHPAGQNESDCRLRWFTQHQTFSSVGQ